MSTPTSISTSSLLSNAAYDSRTCGMARELLAALRKAVADPAMLTEIADRLLKKLPIELRHSSVVIVAPPVGTANIVRGCQDPVPVCVVWLLLDPLDIDSKQTSFLRVEDDHDRTRLFELLYKLTISDGPRKEADDAGDADASGEVSFAKKLKLEKSAPMRLAIAQAERSVGRQSRFVMYRDRPEVDTYDETFVLDHFANEIVPGLYLGSMHAAAEDMGGQLAVLGVTGILNCTTDSETACHHSDANIEYARVSVYDSESADLLPYLAGSNAFIRRHLGRGGRVLVHCQRGISRAPTVASAVLSCLGVLPLDALYSIAAVRPQVCPNLGFALALQDLQKQAKKKQVAHDCSFRAREMSTRVRQVPLAVRG